MTGLDAGRRLDSLLKKFLRDLGASSVYKALRKGDIRLNGKKVSPETMSKEGDSLSIYTALLQSSNTATFRATPKRTPFYPDILYQDENFLIINKPLGALVIPSSDSGEDEASLKDWVLFYLRNSYRDSLSFKPAPLHRLDRNTTGLLVFSASLWGAQAFSTALRTHKMEKTYLALVEGLTPDHFYWEDEMSRDKKLRKSSLSQNSGRKGITSGRTIAYRDGRSLIEIKIETGLTHQIRLSCSSHGYPLVGDRKYGSFSDTYTGYYQLHAYSLKFPAELGVPLVTAPLPDSFYEELVGWTLPAEFRRQARHENMGFSQENR